MKRRKNVVKFLLFILISTFLISSLKAVDYSDLGIIPHGPFPSDYTFEYVWGLTASNEAIYMAHKNNITWKNTLLVTFDKGKTWMPILRGGDYDQFFIVDPSNSSRVYYYNYNNNTLSRSDNFGKNWKDITPPYSSLTNMAISPYNSSIVYAFNKYYNYALYISTNYGDNWIDLKTSSRPILKNMYIYRLYVDIQNPYKLYILGYLSNYYGGVGYALYIYQLNLIDPSKDSFDVGYIGFGYDTDDFQLIQNPNNTHEIWAFRYSYGCLYKSTDGGKNFIKNLPDFCGENIYNVKVNGSNVAIATNNGIKTSKDGGNSFSILIGGSVQYMDTLDFNTYYYLKNNQFTYYNNGTETTSGRATILSLTADRNYIGGTGRTFRMNNYQQYENFIGNLGLKRIEKLENGYLVGYRDYNYCYRIASSGSYSYYYSCYDFYIPAYSKDYVYFALYSDIRKIQVSTGNLVKFIANSAEQIAVSNDEKRFAISKSDTIYISDDGGINFRQTVLSDINGINDILIDTNNSNNIIVVGGSGLYHSSDGGKTFSQKFSGNFWNLRQLSSGLILVMSSDRAYESYDGGSTWKPIELPYPYTIYDVTKINNSYFFTTDYGVIELPGAKNVIVLQPNGGQKWNAGSKYVIKWEAPLNSYKFDLRYSTDNKTTWTNIAKVLASNRCKSDGTKYTCTYGWTIPAQDGRKPQSFVRVVTLNNSNQSIGTDNSDKAFVIEVLKLTSPNGGETLRVGSTHTITWQTYALTREVTRVQLQYSTNGGQTWTNIKTITGNPGSYSWTVPNTPSTNCKARVILKDSSGAIIAIDISEKVFTIQQ